MDSASLAGLDEGNFQVAAASRSQRPKGGQAGVTPPPVVKPPVAKELTGQYWEGQVLPAGTYTTKMKPVPLVALPDRPVAT